MAKVRKHLSKAPIVEALIDFQLKPAKEISLEVVKGIADALKGKYEPQNPIFELQTEWSITTESVPHTQSAAREVGIRLHSVDGKYVAQARTNGFTVSRLEPYEDWDTLLTETRSLWRTYVATVEVEEVTRVATRIINNLKLPMKAGDSFDKYFTKAPSVPDELPQGVLGFMQRTVIFKPELGLRANVIQLLQEGIAPEDHVPVILDIDVYKQISSLPASEDIWVVLSELRSFKNDIFFAHLTELAVGLFE